MSVLKVRSQVKDGFVFDLNDSGQINLVRLSRVDYVSYLFKISIRA